MAVFGTSSVIGHLALFRLGAATAADVCSGISCAAMSAEAATDEVSQLQLPPAEDRGPSFVQGGENENPYRQGFPGLAGDWLNPDSIGSLNDGLVKVGVGHTLLGAKNCTYGKDGGSMIHCSPDEVAENQYLNVFPGASTQCLDGSDYYFTFRRGDPKKLIIHFQGGGACWDALSFNLDLTINGSRFQACYHSVEPMDHTTGIHDRRASDNPWADYSILVINYCSGDMHGGSNDYYWRFLNLDPVKIRGFENAMSGISWALAHFGSLDQLTISGSSAGSLGIQLWSRYVLNHFHSRSKDAVVIGDSFVGVLFPPWAVLSSEAKIINTWNMCNKLLMTRQQYYKCKQGRMLLADLWQDAMKEFRTARFSSVQSKVDHTQLFFEKAFEATSLRPVGALMTQTQFLKYASLQMKQWFKNNPNYFVYQVNGDQHTFLPERFLQATPTMPNGGGTDEPSMAQWLTDLVQLTNGPKHRTVCTGEPFTVTQFSKLPNITLCARMLRTQQ